MQRSARRDDQRDPLTHKKTLAVFARVFTLNADANPSSVAKRLFLLGDIFSVL